MLARLIRAADGSFRRHPDDNPNRHRLSRREKKAIKRKRRKAA